MADINKLKKQLQKAALASLAARGVMIESIDLFADAERALAIVRDRLEQEETLETARELRGKK